MKKVDAPDAEYGTHGAGILHRAQQLGMKTAIDVVSAQNSRAKTVVIPALKYVNFCIINELEAGAVTDLYIDGDRQEDAETVRPVLEKIAGMGVADWVVIHTVAASYGYDCQKREVAVVPGLQLPKGYIKGNTGAGDAFFGGVLYGAYTHMELKKALQFATAAAVCSLSEENGTDGMRAAAEIWETDERLRPCDKLT